MKNFFTAVFLLFSIQAWAQAQIPHLQKQGNTTQLIVEGEPYIILGGELGNSSASSMGYMEPIWQKLKAMNVNTILAPVYWELIEPTEGEFDFSLVDSLIVEARNHDMKLVFLWFASWKNSMSVYAPAWVKKDQERFPLAMNDEGHGQEILTPFSQNNLQADLKAFEQLMAHLEDFDKKEQTVIMVQVENEIGMLPTARDHHPAATKAFNEDVPQELISYLEENKGILVPEIKTAWQENGFKTSGNWVEVFGEGLATDEFFMAWYYAKYANEIVEAGKEIYPLPMFVNAALNRPNVDPGDYPSAGPLPHLMDIWKAAGPSIDFLAPDFYNPRFKHWNDLYTRQENPLFIPEHRFNETVAAKAIYAIGHYDALGFAPFSIESTDEPENEPIGNAYDILSQLSHLISEHQGKGVIDGVLFDKEQQETIVELGDYEFIFRHELTLGWSPGSENETWPSTGALIIQTGENEFIFGGTGVVATVKPMSSESKQAGFLQIDEGKFVNEEWIPGRRMNGDQSHQGRHLRIPINEYNIQKFELYTYE